MVWTFAPPIASSVVFSPVTISTMRSLPRYIDALPSTIATTSQNAGMYAPPAADGPNSAQTCGTLPDARHLVVEDVAGAAPTGEQVDLIGDARAGAVDEVDHRHRCRVRPLDDPYDLLHRTGAPRAGLHGGVVSHEADGPAVDHRRTGDHAVCGEPVGKDVGISAVLDERVGVDQQRDAFAREELAPAGVGRVIALRTAGLDLLAQLLQRLVVERHVHPCPIAIDHAT